jgi:hypothetical protein
MSRIDVHAVSHIYGDRKGVSSDAHAFFHVQGRRAAFGV